MHKAKTRLRRWNQMLRAVLSTVVFSVIVAACGTSNGSPPASPLTFTPVSITPVPPSTPTEDPWGGKPPVEIAGDPAGSRLLTATALTPVPRVPTPPLTPEPTPTWELGMDSCINAHAFGP